MFTCNITKNVTICNSNQVVTERGSGRGKGRGGGKGGGKAGEGRGGEEKGRVKGGGDKGIFSIKSFTSLVPSLHWRLYLSVYERS